MDILEIFIPAKATLRNWGVYIIIAESITDKKEYLNVGKIGDNRKGCNPIISRIGNHFSFNKIHSQFRNKLGDLAIETTNCNYRIFYKLFDEYSDENEQTRIFHKNKTNERERFLNKTIQGLTEEKNIEIELINIHTHKPSSKIQIERDLLLNDNEKNEIIEFAETIINKSTAYNRVDGSASKERSAPLTPSYVRVFPMGREKL